MKLLVFEYITGGGLAGEVLPVSLLAEGKMMLQALLDDLKCIPGLDIYLALDERCTDMSLSANTQVFKVTQAAQIDMLLPALIAQVDMVWPIAPEMDGILTGIAQTICALKKTPLLSNPETVALCTDKLSTYHRLSAHALPVANSRALNTVKQLPFSASVIKPIDGVGCRGGQIIENPTQFKTLIGKLDVPERYLLQPLLEGQVISLSCLFKQGRGWLLCCNQQQVCIENGQFHLQACVVNTANDLRWFYENLIQQIAEAMPGLWGYVGVDIIETIDQGPQILEINPRLTTSYAGIKQATGINVAKQVLHLLEGEPNLETFNNQPVRVVIH